MKTKILLIEDNDDFRNAVKGYLNEQILDIEIFEACTGEMGVTKASLVKPDIAIVDLNLPHANGFEVIKMLKEDHPNCFLIVLTMLEVEQFKQLAKELNVVDFVGKSELFDRLVPVVNKYVEKCREASMV